MDKNFIHIDDYMRRRLSGGEEPERPGAWLAMRDLLDKEMPTVATAYNWRRFFGYVTALVLLASVSVGGYMYINHGFQQDAVFAGKVGGASTSNIGQADGNTIPNSRLESVNNTEQTANLLASENGNHHESTSINSSEANNSSNISKPSTAASVATNNNTTTANNHTTIANKAQKTSSTSSSRVYASAKRLPSVSKNKTANKLGNGLKTVANNTAMAAHPENNADNHNAAQASSSQNAMTTSGAQNATNHKTARRTALSPTQLTASKALALNASANAVKMAKEPVVKESAMRLVHDTIARLRINARRVLDANTQKVKYNLDTIPLSELVVARFVSEKALTEKPAAKQNLPAQKSNTRKAINNPSLAAATKATSLDKNAASANEKLLPSAALTDKSVATGTTKSLASGSSSAFKLHLWDAEKVNAAIDKIKFNLAKIELYPGIMMGINGSFFTPNSLGGFQFGLTSLIAINEWWSVLTELKYLYQFNTGSTVRDNYSNVTNGSVTLSEVKGVPYDYYNWTEEHVDHYFNYEVVQSFQLPLALRYCWGRFFAQGGLNLVYNMPIKAKEVARFLNDQTVHADYRPIQTVKEPFVNDDHATVKISDFGSRFGTGYILGAGFSFTPNVYLDFRATQTFWDNAQTQGAKQISKDLFKTPSIQLSVGYRLSGKK